MRKKICALILILAILIVSIDQQKKEAQAIVPIVGIILGMSELEALTVLVGSGVVIYSMPAAVDLAKKYAIARVAASHNEHFDQGVMTITASMAEHARAWIESILPTLGDTVTVTDANQTLGTTFTGTYPYQSTPITHTFFTDANFSNIGRQQIEILGFSNITDWMTYYDNLESVLEFDLGGSTDYYRVKMTAFDALISWSIGGLTGSMLYDQFPYDYISMNDRMRLDVTTALDEFGHLVITVLPRFHEMGIPYDNNWTDDSFLPNVTFPTTTGTGTLKLTARPMSNVSLDQTSISTYPKTDITEIAIPTTFPVSIPIPDTWDDVLEGDPPADGPGEVVPPDGILGYLASLLAALLAIPQSIADSITSTFTTNKSGDTIDFTKLKFAANLFTNKFPFSLPWDLQSMVNTFGSGSTNAPVIPIGIGNVTTEIDMSRFNTIAAAVRVLELFAFGVGLLFGTRKLLGGAS